MSDILNKDGSFFCKKETPEKFALAMIRSVGHIPGDEKRVIIQNRNILSSLTTEQAVSWLYENKGITIVAEQAWWLREKLGMENIPYKNWLAIHKNRRLLSSLTTEQAVSCLSENEGIAVTAAQLRDLMIETKEEKNG